VNKILLIANTDWYLYRFRSSLANSLRIQGSEVVFVSPPGRFVPDIQGQGFRWIAWEVGRQSVNPFMELKAILKLARIYSLEKPSLVHLHTIKPVIYGSIAARLTRVPAVVQSITGRGYVFLGKDIKARLLRSIVKRVYRFVLNARSSMTIFENETDRNYFLDENLVTPRSSTVIKGVGVDTDYYSLSPEPVGTPRIVLAGRMLWDKGVGTFVDAARLLRSRIAARFILIGEPDLGNPASIDVNILDQWVNEGVVEWWGWQADMRSVFASCHIVVLPSLGEGIPTILLEAAATGRPIVATDVPGCRDVVVDGFTGLLVPQQDSLALATALEKLTMNPKMRKTMGRAGREYIIQRFSSSKINHETFRIYQNLSKVTI
jgi:glycosyltransferase involved in cell wall biosynthesis